MATTLPPEFQTWFKDMTETIWKMDVWGNEGTAAQYIRGLVDRANQNWKVALTPAMMRKAFKNFPTGTKKNMFNRAMKGLIKKSTAGIQSWNFGKKGVSASVAAVIGKGATAAKGIVGGSAPAGAARFAAGAETAGTPLMAKAAATSAAATSIAPKAGKALGGIGSKVGLGILGGYLVLDWIRRQAEAEHTGSQLELQAGAAEQMGELATPESVFYQAMAPGAQQQVSIGHQAILQKLLGGGGPQLASGEMMIGG